MFNILIECCMKKHLVKNRYIHVALILDIPSVNIPNIFNAYNYV